MASDLENGAHSLTSFTPFRATANDTSGYRPLDLSSKEIRIITLHAKDDGGEETDIKCSISHVSLLDPDHCKYEALSYCWGDVDDTVPITLHHSGGDEGDAVVTQQYQVTRNLYAALQHFQLAGKTRRLWVDAICINQSDPVERSEQVGFMRHIYANSEGVLVWLGEEDVCSEIFLRMIQVAKGHTDKSVDEVLRDAVRNQTDTEGEVEYTHDTTLSELDKLLHETDNSWDNFTAQIPEALVAGIWRAMAAFVSRPWFRRTWVIQEVLSAPRHVMDHHKKPGKLKAILTIGKSQLDWDSFLTSRFIVWRLNPLLGEPWLVPPKHRSTYNQFTSISMPWHQFSHSRHLSVLLVLWLSFKFQASDARDRLFAILGLSPETLDSTNRLIVPNYTKSLGQAFTDFSRWHIEESRSLRILLFAPARLVPGVPSWATYFADPEALQTDATGMHHLVGDLESTAPDLKKIVKLNTGPDVSISFSGPLLQVPGLVLSRVRSVCHANISFDNVNLRLHMNIPPDEASHGLPVAEDLMTWFLRTYWDPLREPSDAKFLYGCLRIFGDIEFGNERWAAGITAYMEHTGMSKSLHDTSFLSSLPKDPDISKRYGIGRFCGWMARIGMCIFSTEDGDLGYGYKVGEGDLIVVLQSATSLHVLRPCDGEGLEEKFLNVGGCIGYDQQPLDHERYHPTEERPLRMFDIV